LDSEESHENVDDNDGAKSSSSRLASGTLQPIDRTHARKDVKSRHVLVSRLSRDLFYGSWS